MIMRKIDGITQQQMENIFNELENQILKIMVRLKPKYLKSFVLK